MEVSRYNNEGSEVMEHRLDEIICNSLKIVNRDGQVAASVESDEQGNGKVVICDKRGKTRVEVDGTGNICVFGEFGLLKAWVGTNEQGDGFVTVIGEDSQLGKATPKNAPPDRNLDRSDQLRPVNDRQFGKASPKNTSPNGIRGRLGQPELDVYSIRGCEKSVTHTKPISVTFGERTCVVRNGSWQSLIAELCESLGVQNPNKYTQWNANTIRQEIVALINLHIGLGAEEITFEVYRN